MEEEDEDEEAEALEEKGEEEVEEGDTLEEEDDKAEVEDEDVAAGPAAAAGPHFTCGGAEYLKVGSWRRRCDGTPRSSSSSSSSLSARKNQCARLWPNVL